MLMKACPKCCGDLYLAPDLDLDGGPPDLACLQCGYRARPAERAALLTRVLPGGAHQPAPVPKGGLRRRVS